MTLDVALRYRQLGLCVLPADAKQKRPALKEWTPYEDRLPTEEELAAWFRYKRPLCLVAGAVSGNLELLDFDVAAELFEPWKARVVARAPHLLEHLVIERSQTGGRHVVYRCECAIPGSQKLAQRAVPCPNGDERTIAGKKYKPRKVGDQWQIVLTLIETRGEGGIFLCAPTRGYELLQHSFEQIPVLTEEEREIMLAEAAALNEYVEPPKPPSVPTVYEASGRPGDDYNQRGDVRSLLLKHGWTLARGGENEYWRRPGKDYGNSATLRDGVFYVFSSNAAPFEPHTAYGPFAVYAALEHNGDFEAAARQLRMEGFGTEVEDSDVDLSGLLAPAIPVRDSDQRLDDPGVLPDHLLRVPGFISEVMDYSLATAPYPNQVMAFCGALALQAFLAGRKVRDQADNRTNLYLLGLAHSASGKDWPRKVNTRVLHEIGMADCLGDRFASGEGIQDALFTHPAMLFQTDEIDGVLMAIKTAKDARHENMLGALLSLYTSANVVVPRRWRAGHEAPGVIDQPCLVLFGTAVPNHYYDALSERMLTNGFFARTITLESGKRSKGQEPVVSPLPDRVLSASKWWADYRPGTGNLETWHPVPAVVEHTQEARCVFAEAREEADDEYAKAEDRGDAVATTVWGRVNEQARKLALVHAVSANHELPAINKQAATWAREFACHQARRMLYQAQGRVAHNPFHAECLKLIEKLQDEDTQTLPHSVALKRMKMDALTFQRIVQTLVQQGDIEVVVERTEGRSGAHYRLVKQARLAG